MHPARAALRTVWNREARDAVAQHATQVGADIVHFHNTFPALSPATLHGVHAQAAVVQTLHNFRLVCPAASLLRNGKPCEACVGTSGWRGVVHACYRGSRGATLATAVMTSSHRIAGTWANKVDAYIALTPFTRDVFVRGGLDASKIFVKPNFVSLRAPDQQPDQERNGVLFVGRLEEGKGIRVLMDAWRRMREPLPLKIIGSGDLLDEVRAFASVVPNVELLGHVSRDRVIDELHAARMMIAPMLWFENFPLSVCEAMAAGCAVVAADSANLRAILLDGEAGVLFKHGDPVDLARVATATYGDKGLCERVRATARREYDTKYTPEANYRTLMSIYEHSRTRTTRV